MKNTLRNTFFSLITIILFFAILEIGWRIKISHENKDSRYLFYGTNFFVLRAKGLATRIYNNFHKKDAENADKIILTYGGSTTECPGLKREDSWPYRLGRYLGARVINYGKCATNLDENLGEYRSYIYNDNKIPDVVIFYFGVNDAATLALGPARKRLQPSFFEILDCRLMDTSLLYASLKEKYFLFTKRDINEAWRLKSPCVERDLKAFEKNLNYVISLSNGFGIKLIVCREPISRLYFDKNRNIETIFNEIGEIMKRACKNGKAHFIDVHKEIFRKYNDFDRYYLGYQAFLAHKRDVYIDGIHLNEEGNDLIARFLADYIKKNNIL